MRQPSVLKQQGLSLVELLIAVVIGAVLIAAISGVIGNALQAERSARLQNDVLQQARFAMGRMVNAVVKTRHLMIPLCENPATAWKESERNVLAVTMDPTLDRDKDGWADANNDKDYLDVNRNGIRDAGEPERIDEDSGADATNDGAPGIVGIDDDGDGSVDEGGNDDNDEDGAASEDPRDGIDNDNDGCIDEDPPMDAENDGMPGIIGVDDDLDGLVDEGGAANKADDDEDGLLDEDWRDPVVYYLDGTTLMERMPNIDPIDGNDHAAYAIAENVTQLLVKRIAGPDGKSVLVEITLTLSPPGTAPVTLTTSVRVGSGL